MSIPVQDPASEAAPAPDAAANAAAHHAAGSSDMLTAMRNAFKLGGSLLATWTVALAVRFQLPRHLGPVRFGDFNFCDSFTAAFFVFVTLGVDTYIQKEISVRPKHASEFFGGVLIVRAFVILLLFLTMATVLHVTGHSGELQAVVIVFGLTQTVMGLNQSLAVMLQASTKVGALAAMNVISKLIWGLGVVVGIWLNAPLVLLALPNLVGELAKTMVLTKTVKKTVDLELHVDFQAVKKVLVASFPFYVNGIAITLGGRLDVSMLEFMAQDEEVGWYSAANNFAGLAMLLSPVITWVLMPLFARAKHRSEDEFFQLFRRAIEGLLLMAIPVTLFIALGADLWVRVAFGTKFGPSAVSLRFLAPIFVATYLAMLLSLGLILLERGWRLTTVSLVGLAVQPVLILACVTLLKNMGPGWSGAGAALGVSMMELLVCVMFVFTLGRQALDRRNVTAIAKAIAVSLAVVVLHLELARLGYFRLIVDMLVYVVLALAVRAVRPSEVRAFIQLVIARKKQPKAA
jgi:O-antigen/teichoic acid export membrane protein